MLRFSIFKYMLLCQDFLFLNIRYYNFEFFATMLSNMLRSKSYSCLYYFKTTYLH